MCFSYHHFKIKAPTGTPLVIRPESNEHDPFALACHIPSKMDGIPESLRAVEMTSKSQKKKYTLQEVLGSQIGRVQYFLNRELSFLLNCGKITIIQGYVNIETAQLFSSLAKIVASKSKQYYLLTGSLLFKDCSWGTDYNCPTHRTAEVSQEQAGWWRGLYPSVSKNYWASAAHGIRTRATSSSFARV